MKQIELLERRRAISIRDANRSVEFASVRSTLDNMNPTDPPTWFSIRQGSRVVSICTVHVVGLGLATIVFEDVARIAILESGKEIGDVEGADLRLSQVIGLADRAIEEVRKTF